MTRVVRGDLEVHDAYPQIEQKASPLPLAFFHRLCGGMPIELAWSSLLLFEREVLPAFR